MSAQEKARALKIELKALQLAYLDPRTPAAARWLGAGLLAYAISPIDLIPDFIPVLGYLDDLILLPAGIFLLRKLLPREVLEECRLKAQAQFSVTDQPRNEQGEDP